jgi:DNA repair protein RAD51
LSKIPIDNFSLIIIDNVSDLFSFEYSKKNNFLEKHLSFMKYMYDLSRISITTRIPIVVTNIVRNTDDNEIENLEKSISMYSHVKIKLSKINHEYTCQIISPFNSQKISYVISTGGLTNPS